MGRAPLGTEGRTVQAGLKITKVEEAALSRAFGTPGKALRAFIDSYLAGWLEHPPEQVRREVLTQQLADQLDVPRDLLGEPGRAHPMLDDGPPGLSDIEDDLHVTAALASGVIPPEAVVDVVVAEALDKIEQHLPPVIEEGPLPGTIASGLDSPVVVAAAIAEQQHRHKRGAVIATEGRQGALVRVYSCTYPGCTAELR